MFQFILLFYIGLLSPFISAKLDPINQFTNHTVITAKYYDDNEKQIYLQTPSSTVDCDKINFIKFYDKQHINLFTFKVFVNSHFISDNYYEKYQLNGSYIDENQKKVSNDECFYRGFILNQKLYTNSSLSNQALALNLFREQLNGFLSFDDRLLFVHFHDVLNKLLLFDNQHSKPMDNVFKCGYNQTHEPMHTVHNIEKRSAENYHKIHGFYQQNTQTRFVELLIVNDHKLFLDYNRDKDRLINRSKQIANIVNTLYNQLNIYIVLVGVIVWTEEDEIEITQNGDDTLKRFLKYRKEKLLPNHYNDNAQLLTNVTFKDNVVGKALKGPICTEDHSGGVNSDHNKLIDVVATTVAHELFHNFGGEHDPSDSKDPRICTCPQSKCIMSPSSGSLTPRYWSNCSIENFKEIYQHGMDTCLKNMPKETLSYHCGNGILEGDEECDTRTDTNCCDFKTCKLKVNATCATGNCCDMTTCQLFKQEDRKICRSSTNFCDLPEYCDGVSEFCERDIYAHNGLKCTVDGDESYCFNGKCQSRKSQCKLLFGNSAKVAIDRCYQENARNASQAANCGFELTRFNKKQYKVCKDSDIFCGRLHCIHSNKLEYGLESASTQSLISRNNTVICNTTVIDLGFGIDDPGMVANGVKCGEERMCLNQKCVRVPSSFCKFECNNNGICNSLGKCHCFDGYHPPYCDKFSFLSSLLFFTFLFSLIGCVLFLAYHYRERLQTKWIVYKRTAAIKKRAKSTTFKFDKSKLVRNRQNPNVNLQIDLKSLEISSPIPINNDQNRNTTSVDQSTSSTFDQTTNENLNRLWDNANQSLTTKSESTGNKFVQLPNRTNVIRPARKAPPPPPQSQGSANQMITKFSQSANDQEHQSNTQTINLCNESGIQKTSQSNKVSKLREKFDL